MYTVGVVAKKYGLSRTALLYYDRIGLLCPSRRSEANYRLYSEQDIATLEKIRLYRDAGVPLQEIAQILSSSALNNDAVKVLENRLVEINAEIARSRLQQQIILRLIGNREAQKSRILDKKAWTSLLRATGLLDREMDRWHVEFERLSPEAHQDFLEALGMQPQEITELRKWSGRQTGHDQKAHSAGNS